MRRFPLLLLLLHLLGGCSGKESFPNGPILLVCPWSAGGGSDRVARQVAILLEQDLKVPVNVQNVTGGDGVTGHTAGARARPDGHTLTLVTVELAMLHWRGLTPVSSRHFTPVGLCNRDMAAVFVRADSPWKTLKDLEDAVRAAPRKLRASGTAKTGIWHVALAGWLKHRGLDPADLIWVSIPGSAPSLAEQQAGGVEVVCCSLPEGATMLRAGRVRCLGVMADARLERFPDVPTFREQGVDWTLGTWRGVAAPEATPPSAVAALSAALERVVKGDAYRKFMAIDGFGAPWEGPAEFAKSIDRSDVQLGELLRSPAFRSLAQNRYDAMLFPGILATGFGACLAILLATKKLRWDGGGEGDRARLLEVLGAVVFYLLAAEVLGFVATAAIVLGGLLWRMGMRPSRAALAAAVVAPGLYQLFAVALRVPLPRGLLGW